MSQYSTGTVSTTFAGGAASTNTVTGEGTSWLANVEAGNEIIIDTDTVPYVVTAVVSDTELTISPAYGSEVEGVTYAIYTDFTANLNLPLIDHNAINWQELVNRSLHAIDAGYAALAAGGSMIICNASAETWLSGWLLGIDPADGVIKRAPGSSGTFPALWVVVTGGAPAANCLVVSTGEQSLVMDTGAAAIAVGTPVWMQEGPAPAGHAAGVTGVRPTSGKAQLIGYARGASAVGAVLTILRMDNHFA